MMDKIKLHLRTKSELEVTLVFNLNDQGVLSDGISKAIYLLLIHVEVWQKTTKFCKAIIL